jgi:pimeloyl-ACP methyl ester carboxylesterase
LAVVNPARMFDMALTVRSVKLHHGVELPYAEQGNPAGVPLLLLHAIADSWRIFEPVLNHLPESIHAFVPTQRGHGDASRPAEGYTPRDFAADLLAFMDALGIGRAVIAGGSSGGFIARRFAIDHPERTLGLALLGSPATLQNKAGVLKVWDTTISKLADPVDPAFVRNFVASTIPSWVPAESAELLVHESMKVPAHVWKATFKGLLLDDAFQELGRIHVPTLIVWGEQDSILPRSDQEALAAAIAGSRLVVYPGVGHLIYWEQPARVAFDLVSLVTDVVK